MKYHNYEWGLQKYSLLNCTENTLNALWSASDWSFKTNSIKNPKQKWKHLVASLHLSAVYCIFMYHTYF